MNLKEFRATKAYDLLAASPNILWLANGVRRQLPVLSEHLHNAMSGTLTLTDGLQFAAVLASAALYLTLIYFSAARVTPVARSTGVLPRLAALAGTFITTSLLSLPVVTLALPAQTFVTVLIFCGSIGSVVVLRWLGRSFSLMPEARQLVTSGPYASVRHPLYTVEAVAVLGTALQFQQPWALLIWVTNCLLQYARSVFEERVLEREYPEYAAYRARTKRFIPGVF